MFLRGQKFSSMEFSNALELLKKNCAATILFSQRNYDLRESYINRSLTASK
jgi:hypothetical protein